MFAKSCTQKIIMQNKYPQEEEVLIYSKVDLVPANEEVGGGGEWSIKLDFHALMKVWILVPNHYHHHHPIPLSR